MLNPVSAVRTELRMKHRRGIGGTARRIGHLPAQYGAAARFCRLLNRSGHRAFFVGGSVRDVLSRIEPGDADLATDALPPRVQELAERNHIRTSLHGARFGAVKLHFGQSPVVVTTFRRDRFDGRNTTVSFTRSLSEDALRRDFTVNAIYADCEGRLHDPLDGLADLGDRIVRFIGCPDFRIREDPFRILRYFRIRAGFADLNRPADPETLEAISRHAGRLREVPRERVGSEFLKLLGAEVIYPTLADMLDCGVLPLCLPGSEISRIRDLEKLEKTFEAAPDPVRRLAALGGDSPKRRLRLDRRSGLRLDRLCRWIRRAAPVSELAYRLGERDALDVVLARAAVSGRAPDPCMRDLLKRSARQRFPVRASDLNQERQGPELGKALKRLEKKWLDSEFGLDRCQLLELAER